MHPCQNIVISIVTYHTVESRINCFTNASQSLHCFSYALDFTNLVAVVVIWCWQ